MPAGAYLASATAYPMPLPQAAPPPARSHRRTIAVLAAAVLIGSISAVAFQADSGDGALAPLAPQPAPLAPQLAPPAPQPAPQPAPPAPPATSTVQPTFPVDPAPPKPAIAPVRPTAPSPRPPTTRSPRREPGVLRVRTTPWAWVTVGADKQKTPSAQFKLAPGRYTVRLEFPTLGITETKQVAIEPGKSFTINLDKSEEE
jgi:hypothetical protein